MTQPSPTNLSDELDKLLPCICHEGMTTHFSDCPRGNKSAITAAYAEAMNEIIGEDVKPDFDDDDWFCQRCSFGPTDGSKDCICKYNNRLKRRQRQRLQGLLPTNASDEGKK